MDRSELVTFIHKRGLAVVATRGPDGAPQAALVGVAATDQAEIIFDTSASSRRYRNVQANPDVALVVGWDDEVTVQCEGRADILTGVERSRCLRAYFDQYPDGRRRAQDPDIVHVRIRPHWVRYSDYRPDSFANHERRLDGQVDQSSTAVGFSGRFQISLLRSRRTSGTVNGMRSSPGSAAPRFPRWRRG